MKIIAPVVASAVVALALPAAADAATKRIPACDGQGKPATRCGDGGAADAKRAVQAIPGAWSIVAVDLTGTTKAHSDDDSDSEFTMAGGTTIRSGAKVAGTFKGAGASVVQVTASPVTTKVTSSAHWTGNGTGTYNCDLKWDDGALPTTVTATGGASRTLTGGISLQWNFLPSGWSDCFLGDARKSPPSPPTAPIDLTTTTYPAHAFTKATKGAKRRLLINIDRTFSEGGIVATQTWKGSVTIRATRKVG